MSVLTQNISNPPYSFISTSTADLIDQAYKSIGITDLSNLTQSQSKSAIYAINEILSEWVNRQILQFDEVLSLLKLENKKTGYALPNSIYDIYDVSIANFSRLTSTAFVQPIIEPAPAIDPTNAFGYDFTLFMPEISTNYLVGITNTVDSNNEYPVCWAFGLSMADVDVRVQLWGVDGDQTLTTTSYQTLLYDSKRNIPFYTRTNYTGVQWFVLNSSQQFQTLYLQFNKAVTINKIFFLKFNKSQTINNMGRSDYIRSMVSPLSYARPSFISLEKNNNQCNIRTWPIPNNLSENYNDNVNNLGEWNFLYFRGAKLPYSTDYLSTELDLNFRFVPALRAALSYKLSKIYASERTPELAQEAEAQLRFAMANDKDNQAITLNLNVAP